LAPDHFGTGIEELERTINGKRVQFEWDWGSFRSTEGFPVDDNLINWAIGQEQALKECFLCLDEWVHKLKWLERRKWYEIWSHADKEKPSAKTVISPGPYLFLLGDPGTGKSLIGKALAEKLTFDYSASLEQVSRSNDSAVYQIPRFLDPSPVVIVLTGRNSTVFFAEWVAYPQVPTRFGADFTNSASLSSIYAFTYMVKVGSVIYRCTVRLGGPRE